MLQRCYKALLTHNGMCVGVFVCYCKGACGHAQMERNLFALIDPLNFAYLQ